MARNTQGEIPDSNFENEPTYPPKNVSPLSKSWEEKIKDSDKYRSGDEVGGY
jgi:hypothetical protein